MMVERRRDNQNTIVLELCMTASGVLCGDVAYSIDYIVVEDRVDSRGREGVKGGSRSSDAK